MNLKTIPHMRGLFSCPVGLSDHSLGIGASIAAVSLGAQIIEKHFTLSRNIKTLDSFFSIEPPELKSLVENIRIAEKALGKVCYRLTGEERENQVFRRSLFVTEDVKAGEILTKENTRAIRPGYGLHPKYLKEILGKKAKKSLRKGRPLSWKMIE